MIGLCDCNSFFSSCEALFRPDLKDKGIVVLSNNDGCIVTADRIAKAKGLQRGDNWFEVKDIANKRGVKAFSSNNLFCRSIRRAIFFFSSSDRLKKVSPSMGISWFVEKVKSKG